MAETIAIAGAALAYVERPFGSFTDRATGEVVQGGTTRTLWVGTEFDVEPTQIKVSADRAPDLRAVTRGSMVECVCMIFANGNKLSYRLETVAVKQAARAA